MARTKGMLNLSGNLEVNAQAPLDARTIVPTEADLTVASNFPYPYVGLEVYVTSTGKKFRLINLDTTQSSSWHEVGEGGGSGGGGHTIQDDGTDMTARDNLNFVGMEVDDNDSDGSTDVAEHRLTSAEISEMMGGIPNPTPRYPVIVDERGTEYQVGWYILSNGTKKPVYEKTITNLGLARSWDGQYNTHTSTFRIDSYIPNVETFISAWGIDDGRCIPVAIDNFNGVNDSVQLKTLIGGQYNKVKLVYTKTTDTPV